MNLTNERIVDMVEYDMDLTDEETKTLCAYALEKIATDEKALTNYAIVHMLGEICKNLQDPKEVKKFIKAAKKLDKTEKSDKLLSNEVAEAPKKRGRKPKVK